MSLINLILVLFLPSMTFCRRHPITPTPQKFMEVSGQQDDMSCIKLDECSCSFVDSSGDINLHSLQGKTSEPKFTVQGSGWTFKYNPCQTFQLGSYSLVVGQTNNVGGNYDLGVQSTMTFNTTADNKLFVHYIAGDNDRRSRIILECDPNSVNHNLRFVGEIEYNPSLYEFVLTSPCACPGYCDDDGIVDNVEINSPEDDVEIPHALNRVEMRLLHLENKLTSIRTDHLQSQFSLSKVQNSLNSLKNKLSEFSLKVTEGNANTDNKLQEVEELLLNIETNMNAHEERFADYIASQERNSRLVDASLPPMAALIIHDLFIIVIVVIFAHIFATTRKRIMKRLFQPKREESEKLYKSCNCSNKMFVKNI